MLPLFRRLDRSANVLILASESVSLLVGGCGHHECRVLYCSMWTCVSR